VNRAVLDCSVALSWCFEDEATPEADALLDRVRDEGALVPSLWHLELANVLLQAERRRRISAEDVATRLSLFAALPILTDPETMTRAWHDILSIARVEGLTTYDAAYLELAIRAGVPLLTKDGDLLAAAKRRGVAVLP
jgi:predicted nucleic acid-binding protein